MPISSMTQYIRRVKVASFVGNGSVALLGITTPHSVLLLLLSSTLSLLHKGLLQRRGLFGLVILLLVLGLGCKPQFPPCPQLPFDCSKDR